MKNTGAEEVLAELWYLQKLWGHFRMRNKGLNIQEKMLVGWPGISTEASQVGHSFTLRSVLGAPRCRLAHVFAQQNHPKALPLKYFNVLPKDGRSNCIAIYPVSWQPV